YHIDIYKGNDETLLKYLKIIHSADAYANLINFSLGNQNLDGLEDGYSEEILNKFYNNEPLFNVSVNTKLERLLKSLSATSCIKFPLLRKEVIDKNYIEIFYDTYEQVLNSEDRIVYRKAVDYLKNHYLV
ncbi:MAG: hypothetical protein ACI4PF_05610, partial [Christensenellales bacterium]